jgi:hypothetical protein
MLNYKAQATAIVNKMEMYARIHRFSEHHNALLETPNDMYALERLEHAIRHRSSTNRTEDNYVYEVYYYFRRLASYEWTDSTYFNEIQSNYDSLNEYRFPPASKVRAEFARHLEERAHAADQPLTLVNTLARILRNHRPWFSREWHNSNGELHPAVFKAWDVAEPADWHQLVMEWPHVSKQGAHMVAYTRDEKYGEADRQLAGTVSKYLTRHFPALNSNVIRDISGMYTEAEFGIVRTMPEMLDIVIHGPESCMSGEASEFREADGHHPYEVYDPQYGWHMAYVKEGGKYTGRALLNDTTWVRTYRRRDGHTYSDTDERLNSWLREQGYSKADGWRGFSVARICISNNCGILAPYIDGHERDLSQRDSGRFKIVSNGEYHCSNTDGSADERNSCTCDCCGTRMSEDDSHGVGRHCDSQVCPDCYSDEYTTVYGRRGEEYSVHNDNAIEVDGEWYHDEWLSDNNIVELHNGEYTHHDNAVYIESQGEYYPAESELICYTQDGEYEMRDDCVELENGEWCLEDEAWCCDHTGDYYANSDVAGVTTMCGKLVHPDHAEHYVLVTAE